MDEGQKSRVTLIDIAADAAESRSTVRNAVSARATRFRKLIPSALETRSAQDSYPDYSTANLSGTLSPVVPPLARFASLPSAITRGCPTDVDSKRSWKESYLPADKLQ